MISLRKPSGSSSSTSLTSLGKRPSTAMSVLLDEVNCPFGAVGDRKARIALLAWWHGAVVKNLAEALVVVAKQVRNEVVAATVALASLGVDLHPYRTAAHAEIKRTFIRFVKTALRCSLSLPRRSTWVCRR